MGGMAFQPKELHVGRRVEFADSIKCVVGQRSIVGRWLVRMIWHWLSLRYSCVQNLDA